MKKEDFDDALLEVRKLLNGYQFTVVMPPFPDETNTFFNILATHKEDVPAMKDIIDQSDMIKLIKINAEKMFVCEMVESGYIVVRRNRRINNIE